jgi:hypothetical protein
MRACGHPEINGPLRENRALKRFEIELIPINIGLVG